MKKMNLLKISTALVAALGINVAVADTIDGTASAVVLTPLTLTETTALNFGTIAGGSTAGTVVVTEAGVRTATGGTTLATGVAASQAVFDITGANSTAITVTMVTAGAQLDDGAVGAVMPLSTFTNTALPTTTSGTGTAQVSVGATLAVGANQAAGVYTTALGTGAPYTISVNYN